MFLFRLALKNLTRHKRRVLITASIIAVGIALFLIYDSVQLGLNRLSFNNIRNLETGHLQVVNKNYWQKRDKVPLDNLISEDKKLMQIINSISDYQAAAPQLKFSANLNNGIDELPVVVYGIEPNKYQQVFMTGKYLIEGEMLESGEYEAVLGKRLAELMEFKLGDYITLVFRNNQRTFNTIDAKITGLIHTNNPTINNNFVYIPLDITQRSLNLENKVSQIVIRLNQVETVKKTKQELSTKLAATKNDLEAHSWRDFAGEVIAMSKAETAEKVTIMGLILLIAAVGIVNTIILSSLERIKEIGMMKALGLKEREIILIFIMEAAGIGFIGGVIGSFLGGIFILYLNINGIDLTSLIGNVSDWGLPVMGKLYAVWNFKAFIFVIVFGVIISVVASILPARWAAKKDPVEAIYGNHN